MPLSPEEQEKGSVEMAAVLADIAANPWPSDIGEARVLYDKMGPPIAADIRTQHITLGQVSGLMLTPPELDEDRAVLFLHGGGYVYGSMLSHGGMVAEIARAARCRALLLQYRLAPEHPFPAGIEDACAAYAWLLQQGYRPEQLALIGDSAGGGARHVDPSGPEARGPTDARGGGLHLALG
ncbi:alpha/beta hydrolase fold domain-containing protein [Haliangium sp. UPWRP_2]|uniref:alpha/beta hydrolase n=1 Tax=Haliangium sp. UPWRP_2 TaxID=1931276 RepID=UPI000B5426FA|nr:alpha/beta hydrolase fold domain-containing protein [Haliangium sp. UPWRP_2]PSM31505.1 hypothetical protein BVG81_005060 [Haliangium sp. UPWRP_2]